MYSRACLVFATLRGYCANRVRDRVRSASERASGSTSSRDAWRDPATASASCWLQRTNINAVVTFVAHACVLPWPAWCTKLAPAC